MAPYILGACAFALMAVPGASALAAAGGSSQPYG